MGVREGVIIDGGSSSGGISSLAIAAHELKSPLALIRQLSLEIGDETIAEHDKQRINDQILQVSEKALRLTSDITKVERLQSELFSLEPIDPISLCDEVRFDVAKLYEIHGKSLKRIRRYAIPPVIANRDLLRRVLLNFADNALYYADNSAIVELRAQHIKDRHAIRMSVRDFGVNPTPRQKKEFRSLSQQRSHKKSVGSGLGLHIAAQFAHVMNGSIGTVCHRDGTSFYIELPISQQLSLL